jgi:hypothetical protein
MFIWGGGFSARSLLWSLVAMLIVMGVVMMLFRGQQWPVFLFCCWPGLFTFMGRLPFGASDEEKAKRKRKNDEYGTEPDVITTPEGDTLEVVDEPRGGAARVYPDDGEEVF